MAKQKELMILKHLRKDGRAKLVDIAKDTQIPISTIFDYVRKENGKLIKKFATILDFTRMGYNTRAHIVLRINKDHREKMREYLCDNQNVNSIYKINNGYDFLIEGVFREVKDLEEFLDKLEERFEIKQKNVYYIIDDIKREEFMANLVL